MMASQSDGDLFAINNPTSCSSYINSRRKNISGGLLHTSSSQQQQQQQHQLRCNPNYNSNSDTTYLLNTTQMRHVQNSLKRLEQQQDEFFEL